MITDEGNITYRGYTMTVSDIQVHIWHGAQFIQAVPGEPARALAETKKLIDEWMVAP